MILFLSWHTRQAIMKRLLQEMPLIVFFFIVSLMIQKIATHECGIASYSIYQMMLKGHTFNTFNARPGSLDCSQACNSDVRCQSYNYVIFKDICELNNRTKDASPEDFVRDKDRYYMNAPKRVPLGSIPELAADSCAEIKANEGEQAASGSYWIDYSRSGSSLLAHCDMNTNGTNFCRIHRCLNHGTCVNSPGNFTCLCNSAWWTGRYCEQALLPPVVGCVSLTRSEATNGYEVNATHGKPPHFCLVLPEEEIKGGNPYTMTVELMNVIGKDGDVNHGHPGVMYNVIDQNNFDTMHLRTAGTGVCFQLGYLSAGEWTKGSRGQCPNGNPGGGVWFTVRIEVSSNQTVNIYLNDDCMTSLTSHFSTKGRGGVLVQNGHDNIIQFRNFNLTGTN